MTHLLLHKTPNSVSSEPGAAHPAPGVAKYVSKPERECFGSFIRPLAALQGERRYVPISNEFFYGAEGGAAPWLVVTEAMRAAMTETNALCPVLDLYTQF